MGMTAEVPADAIPRSARCNCSVNASGIGSENTRNTRGIRMALVRLFPRKSSDSPGNARISAAAESSCVCIPASSACSASAGTRTAKPQTLEDGGSCRMDFSFCQTMYPTTRTMRSRRRLAGTVLRRRVGAGAGCGAGCGDPGAREGAGGGADVVVTASRSSRSARQTATRWTLATAGTGTGPGTAARFRW